MITSALSVAVRLVWHIARPDLHWQLPPTKLSNPSPRHGSPRLGAPGALPARVPGGIIGRDGGGGGGPAPLRRSRLQGLRVGRGGDAAGCSQSSRRRGGAQEDPQEEAGLLE